MNDDARNVIAFQPRAKVEPALQFVEIRLLGDCCDLQMSLHDDAGDVVEVLIYAIASKSPDFDLGRLIAAWDAWRGGSAAAS